MLHGHGDDLYRYGGKIRHNFSSNVYSDVDHSALMSHLAGLGDILKNYPEPEALSLEAKIASVIGVAPEEVLVTNGATEAIYLIAMSQRGRETQIVAPAFREYQDACAIHGVTVRFIADIAEISESATSLWLCNPANPTGHVTDIGMLKSTIGRHPDKLFVIDQAYAAYSVLPVLDAKDAVAAGNVILLSSLTKDFAVPGLRIGYAVGNREILDRLRSMRMPWSVNAIAIEAAGYLLDHRHDYRIDTQFLHREAQRLAAGFSAMGISTTPTDCNFLLCQLPHSTASTLKQYLIDNHGILIRDASNFEGLTSRHFRVAAQSPSANTLLLSATRRFLNEAQV